MKLTFTPTAWEEYLHWQQTDKKILRRINTLIKDIQRNPFDGIGKPEALKLNLSGKWSRRITEEHRLVYMVKDREVVLLQFRYHYSKSKNH